MTTEPRSLRTPRFARTLALLVAGLLGALAAAPAAAQNDWRPCAAENGQCRFAGEAAVRFGVPGRYAFKVARDGVACTTDEFGDPAPGQVKQCDYSVGWRQDERYGGWREPGREARRAWRFCADEGGACDVGSGQAQVRFGVPGRYETRTVSGTVACTTRVFGDPAPGRTKRCEINDHQAWTLCANEREFCRTPGAAQVRYGAAGRYAYRDSGGQILCDNGSFGDPAPGLVKQCEYRSAGAAAATPLPGAPGQGLPWVACAAEGGACQLRGPAMLRYGAEGRYAYLETAGGAVACDNRSFGVDPAPDRRKQCEVLQMR